MTASFHKIEGQANKRAKLPPHAMYPGEHMPILSPSPWTILRSDLRGAALGLLVLAMIGFVAWAAMVMLP